MNATLTGVSSSLITILIFSFLKRLDKTTIYGLILMGIGFLCSGLHGIDLNTAIVSGIQALFFMSLAYLGIKENYWFLVGRVFSARNMGRIVSPVLQFRITSPRLRLFLFDI